VTAGLQRSCSSVDALLSVPEPSFNIQNLIVGISTVIVNLSTLLSMEQKQCIVTVHISTSLSTQRTTFLFCHTALAQAEKEEKRKAELAEYADVLKDP
jgi:hypothetical protein